MIYEDIHFLVSSYGNSLKNSIETCYTLESNNSPSNASEIFMNIKSSDNFHRFFVTLRILNKEIIFYSFFYGDETEFYKLLNKLRS